MGYSYTKNELYKSYLYEINGIKFTSREIDIISCVVHNRGNKKIAALLSIAHRTVDTHVYNVISKINKSSREDIIDFVEKSGKIPYIKKYYLCLLIESTFNKKLLSIAKTINKEVITYIINDENFLPKSQESNKIISQKLHYLQKDLKLANVILNLNVSQSVYFYILKPSDSDQKKATNIGLLLDNVDNLSTKQQIEYIDFTTNQNYYFSVFDLLKKIINKPELDIIKEEFQKEYYLIVEDKELSKGQSIKIGKTIPVKVFLSIFLIGLVFSTIYCIYYINKHKLGANQAHNQVLDIKEFNLIKDRIENAAEYYDRDQTTTWNTRKNNKNILTLQKDIDFLLQHSQYLKEDDSLQSKFCYLVTVLAAQYRWNKYRNISVDDYLSNKYKECTLYNNSPERFHLCVHSILLERTIQYYRDRYKIIKNDTIQSIVYKLNREPYALEDFTSLSYAQARGHFPKNSWNNVDLSDANNFINRYLDLIATTQELKHNKPFDLYLILKYQQIVKRYSAENLIKILQQEIQQEFSQVKNHGNLINIINNILLTSENLVKLRKIIDPQLEHIKLKLKLLKEIIPALSTLLNDTSHYFINDKPWLNDTQKSPITVIIPKEDRFNIGTIIAEILLSQAVIVQYNVLMYYSEQEKLNVENKKVLLESIDKLGVFVNNQKIQINWNDLGVISSKDKIRQALEVFKKFNYNSHTRANIQILIEKISNNKFDDSIKSDVSKFLIELSKE